MMVEQASNTWRGGLILQIKAQPLRASTLAALLILMGFLWTKHFAPGSSPSRAGAASAIGANKPSAAVEPAAENLSRGCVALRNFLGRPPAAVGRNLFVVELEHFPGDGSKLAGDGKTSGFWDMFAKSLAAKADQEKARRILIDNLRTRASKLNVQAILNGNGTPRALVDGRLAAEGDSVAGFRILKIEASRIIVEREGVRLEVRSSLN